MGVPLQLIKKKVPAFRTLWWAKKDVCSLHGWVTKLHWTASALRQAYWMGYRQTVKLARL